MFMKKDVLEQVLIVSKGFHALKIEIGAQKGGIVSCQGVTAHLEISQGHDQLSSELPIEGFEKPNLSRGDGSAGGQSPPGLTVP